jgi:hypothetical protein
MAITSKTHLEFAQLSDEEQQAVSECGTWLPTAKFIPQDDYEVCDDITGLENSAQLFITKFAPWRKVKRRMTVLNIS